MYGADKEKMRISEVVCMYIHMYIAIGHIKFVISFPDVPHAQ